MIETGNSFDDLADKYAQYRVGYSRSLYDALEEFGFRSGWHVLDVGCGTGLASAPLVMRGMQITGVDPSEAMLEYARANNESSRFVRGRAEKLPFADNEFDAVVCAQSIHWFDQPKAIAEMMRVVKPGGRVAVWWKKLVVDDPLRPVRSAAAAAAGVDETPDLMTGSFKAFYGAPLGERWLRVVPQLVTTDATKWMGYERSRRRAREAYGAKLEGYLAELERRIREKAEEKPFQVRYNQYLYVGEVP